MATYKVAQDVEAEDKLLGPFGFRQFIYLIIVAMSGFLGYGLWQILPPLAIIPAPIMIFFGALALPLRKDQPMETYLAALVSFYIKPHRRLWEPDGIDHIIEITAPKSTDDNRTKNFGGDEADQRLSYLADLADTRGWAIRHVSQNNTSMAADVYDEARQTNDILDDDSTVAHNIDSMISRSDSQRRQQLLDKFHQAQTPQQPTAPQLVAAPVQPQLHPNPTPVLAPQPTQQPTPQQITPAQVSAAPEPIGVVAPQFNPYPNMHQSVIQPLSATPAPTAVPTAQQAPIQPSPDQQSTSDNTPSPDIMNLANNSKNLSVETIAREAKRLQQKHDDEVVISLR